MPSKAVKVAPIPSPPPRRSPLHTLLPAAAATRPSFSRRSTTRAPWLSLRASAAAARTLHAAPVLQEAAALRGISGCLPHRAECGCLSGGVPVEGRDGLPNNGSGDARSARVGFKTCACYGDNSTATAARARAYFHPSHPPPSPSPRTPVLHAGARSRWARARLFERSRGEYVCMSCLMLVVCVTYIICRLQLERRARFGRESERLRVGGRG